MTRIAVTTQEFDRAEAVFRSAEADKLECLRAPAAENDLAKVVRTEGVRHVIVGVEKYVGPVYAALPAGGVIARFGVGHDGIDKERATVGGLRGAACLRF